MSFLWLCTFFLHRQEVVNVVNSGADTANVKLFGAVGDGKNDDTKAIIDAVRSNARVIFFPSGTYKISRTIPLNSNKELLGVNQKSVLLNTNVKEMLKTFGPNHYNDITIKGLRLEGNVKEGENKLVICMQFYNIIKVNIINCSFNSSSAGVGFQSCKSIIVKGCTFNGMYQQPLKNATYAGVYGYGIVLNECDKAVIEGNNIGTNSPHGYIMRHAVYISNNRKRDAVSSSDIIIRDNTIFLKDYTKSQPLTGFEYVFKSIGGRNILIERNRAYGGIGGVLLTYNFVNPLNINVENNQFNGLKQYGIFVNPETEADKKCILSDLTVKNNSFIMNEKNAQAFRIINYKKLEIKNNDFVNQHTNTDNRSVFLYLKKNNTAINSKTIEASNNKISGFKQMILNDNPKDKVNLLIR